MQGAWHAIRVSAIRSACMPMPSPALIKAGKAGVQDAVAASVVKALAHELLQIHASDTLRSIVEQTLKVGPALLLWTALILVLKREFWNFALWTVDTSMPCVVFTCALTFGSRAKR